MPVKVLTPGSISANWVWLRFTAQPATYTSLALCSERLTDWRDFASASRVMQQVLITCSSASFSATSSWPACSSWRRASIASAWETLQPRNLTAKRIAVEVTGVGRRAAPASARRTVTRARLFARAGSNLERAER